MFFVCVKLQGGWYWDVYIGEKVKGIWKGNQWSVFFFFFFEVDGAYRFRFLFITRIYIGKGKLQMRGN